MIAKNTELYKEQLQKNGFHVSDCFLSDEEMQKCFRMVLDRCIIDGGFLTSKDDTCSCYIDVSLPRYCVDAQGNNSFLLKVDMAAILADRAAAIAQEGGAS